MSGIQVHHQEAQYFQLLYECLSELSYAGHRFSAGVSSVHHNQKYPG